MKRMKTLEEFKQKTNLSNREIFDALNAIEINSGVTEVNGFRFGEEWSDADAHPLFVQYIYYKDEYVFIFDDYQCSEDSLYSLYQLPEEINEFASEYSRLVDEIDDVARNNNDEYEAEIREHKDENERQYLAEMEGFEEERERKYQDEMEEYARKIDANYKD